MSSSNEVINGVPRELLERTICRLTNGHEHDKAVRELRALLTAQPQASAAQSAPAGEREAFEAYLRRRPDVLGTIEAALQEWDSVHDRYPEPFNSFWVVWQARAALAQLAAIQGGMGEVVEVDVVGWRTASGTYTEDGALATQRNKAGLGPYLSLMTVSQHQRITAAMAAEVERWKERCQYNADTAHDVSAERDALRAELAEVKGREPVYMMRRLDQEAWYVTTFQTYNHIASGKSPQHEAAKLYALQPASPDVEGLVKALTKTVASLDQLLPYLGKIPADVGLINDALVAARPLLEQNTNKEVTPDGK